MTDHRDEPGGAAQDRRQTPRTTKAGRPPSAGVAGTGGRSAAALSTRTPVQLVALVFGIGFLLASAAGFLQGGMSMDPNPDTAPKALGLFPVNVVHNLVHLIFGVWGVIASRGFVASRTFCRIAGVIYLVLIPVGFMFPSGFGLIPLGGNDPWLHLVLGVPLAFFGFTAKDAHASAATAP